MTVAPVIPLTQLALTGTDLGPFQTSFPFEVATDVVVSIWATDPTTGAIAETVLSLGTDYTMNAPDSLANGGQVTLQSYLMPNGGAGPWASGTELQMQRATELGQATAVSDQVGFQPSAYESALDHLARQIQDWHGQASGDTEDETLTATRPGLYNPYDYGAVGDGVTDDSAALLAANAAMLAAGGGSIILPPGKFYVSASMSLGNVIRQPGSGFYIATGATLTLNSNFMPMGVGQIFYNALGPSYGEGLVQFTGTQPVPAFAEWWGALRNNSAIDCTPAISAALTATADVELLNGSYYMQSVLYITNPGRKLHGQGSSQNPASATAPGSPGTGTIKQDTTTLILTSPSLTGISVGSGLATNLVADCYLRDFTIARATADTPLGVTGAAPIANANTPVAISCVGCVLCTFERIVVIENSRGFYIAQCVECYWNYCTALRYTAGATPASDSVAGFYLNYAPPNVGNGGNASIYIDHCRFFSNVGMAGGPPFNNYTAGLQTAGGFVDLFIDFFESGLTHWGIVLAGDGASSTTFATEDGWARHCVLDSNVIGGIYGGNAGSWAAFSIEDCYIACANNSGAVAIELENIGGMVNLSDNQLIGEGDTTGIYVSNVGQVISHGNLINGFKHPVEITSVTYSNFQDVIHNSVNSSWGNPAFNAYNSQRCFIKPSVAGPPNWNYGVFIDPTCSYMTVDPSLIEPAACVGGVPNKIGGSGYAQAPNFGTNLAMGLLT